MAAPPAPPAPVQEVVVEEVVEETPVWEKYTQEFQEVYAALAAQKAVLSQVMADVRKLEKTMVREMKATTRQRRGRRNDGKKREPSGFAKPTVISKELCDFLGKPYGTELARTEVTKYLTKYIKENSLQQQDDKRYIVPDKKLAKLLKTSKDSEVTYFNLQKWMKHHFSQTPFVNGTTVSS